jgi:hypothetical protein
LIISGITIGNRVLPNPNEMPVSKTQTMLMTKGFAIAGSELFENFGVIISRRIGVQPITEELIIKNKD